MRTPHPTPPPHPIHCAPIAALALIAALAAACVDVPDPDAGIEAEAGPSTDMTGVELQPIPDASPCVQAEEVCNGLDDDCDGRIDESDPTLCSPCVRSGQRGACAEGRTVCDDGQIICGAVGAPPGEGCDLIDGDCDGRWDEADELPALRDVLVVRQCPGTTLSWTRAADPGLCEPPGEVGCGPVHPCLDRACIAECDEPAGFDYARCAGGCGADAETTACRAECRRSANEARQACIARCPAERPDVSRWRCEPGVGGPTCSVTECDDGAAVQDDGRCQRSEVCNNGVDEDGDGLVDGIVADPGACQALYPAAAPTPIGSCPANFPECDGLMASAHPLWSCGATCPYAPLLEYDYALDREEASNRAWYACVQAGRCPEPSGLAWRQAKVLLDSGAAPARPDAPACADPVRLDPRVGADIDPRVVDLPVVGVSWCQARDYCLWAGKRLPTEVEWERAASGVPTRRPWPWGAVGPAKCAAAQCCGTEGERPEACAAGPLPPCPESPEGGPIRQACQATIGRADPACNAAAETCAGCLPGPTPVWSNPDGASPEGVLNLIGNVSEWTFDWASASYDGASTFNPVGAACNQLTGSLADQTPEGLELQGPGQRITRGSDFLRTGPVADALARAPVPPGTLVPSVGFRCARTVQADALCDPGTQGQPPPLEPQPDERPQCTHPDFEDDFGGFELCPNNQRVPSRTCTEGQGRTCTTDTPLGCGTWLTRRLSIDFTSLDGLLARVGQALPGQIVDRPTLDPVTAAFIGRLFDGDLVPNGGRTLIALETGCGFGESNLFPSRLVNATASGRELYEMGLIEGADCQPLATPQIPIVSQAGGVIDNVCTVGRGEFYIEGLGALIPYSGLMLFDVRIDRLAGALEGAMLFIVSELDAADSTLGDDTRGAMRDFLRGLGAPSADLCFLQELGAALDPNTNPNAEPLFGRWSCLSFANWPGCVQGECIGIGGDTSMCTGWLAPIQFQATAREEIDLGYAECSCDAPPEPPE